MKSAERNNRIGKFINKRMRSGQSGKNEVGAFSVQRQLHKFSLPCKEKSTQDSIAFRNTFGFPKSAPLSSSGATEPVVAVYMFVIFRLLADTNSRPF
ncbi:hypothetical protein RA29_07310 [Tateyamaria sp. ANG-S1]|nr:hypothetical protein RA29_07310 [Tateyamaria sp. ANG-S1]